MLLLPPPPLLLLLLFFCARAASNSPFDLQKTQSGLLHLAANSDYVGQLASLALVKELVGRKADLDIQNKEGFRPLHLACGLRHDNRGNEQVLPLCAWL